MGGVDLLDSLIALYRTKIRSRKWYHKIVFHMMDFTLVNAWLLYRRDCKDCGIPKKEVYSLLKFKAEVASCLCNERKVLKKRGRPSHNVDRDLAEKKRRGSASSVPSTPVRQDHTDHWPVWVEKKGRCQYPGCTGIVKVQCSKCVTYLCFTADKNC
ncbi:PiggyBac transposable element-derived protein 2 [Dissostichus eleginoides]|uniref:PiggyBac transposable element-derived protein 2 n=2 Tax=Notothenioidei TaxID=8205 RepID=A0AAD9BII2_DISEL|nr:PiggyBac transposable element-derived protein 2 [Dissostichus eleginoides]